MPFASSRRCQRHAIGQTEAIVIATAPRKYHGLAWTRMRTVVPTSIFQKMYAAQSPVTVSVAATRRSRRLVTGWLEPVSQ
jgi:hypothetical protein